MVKWDNYYLTAHPHTHTHTHTYIQPHLQAELNLLCRPTCGFGGKFQGLLLEPDSLVTTHTLPPSQLAPYHPHNSHPTTLTTRTLPPSQLTPYHPQLIPYHPHNSHPTTITTYTLSHSIMETISAIFMHCMKQCRATCWMLLSNQIFELK